MEGEVSVADISRYPEDIWPLASLTLRGASSGRNDVNLENPWDVAEEETSASVQLRVLRRGKTPEEWWLCCVPRQTALGEPHKNSPYRSLV